ncbi:MAG: NADPH-dependent 2,4-dienoyl-CoA reductase, partial [Herbaspirillum sp.]
AAEAGAGGLRPPVASTPIREIFLLQRKTSKMGAGLGKTSGWVHRATLLRNGVKMLTGVEYQKIDDVGLHITQDGESRLLEVDHIIICAGQNSLTELMPAPTPNKPTGNTPEFHLIGGAKLAAELDAKRAIRDGAELASQL